MTKEIPSKNYIILSLIVISTVILVFYAKSWYNTTRNYSEEQTTEGIREITTEELKNYIYENPKFILYTSSKTDNQIKPFEKKFKKLLIDKNLINVTLYLDIDSTTPEQLTNIIHKKTTTTPTLYIFDNGKIKYIIYDINKQSLSKINKQFKKYGVIND